MKKFFVFILGGWLCEEGIYHFRWEKRTCCWIENTLRIEPFEFKLW